MKSIRNHIREQQKNEDAPALEKEGRVVNALLRSWEMFSCCIHGFIRLIAHKQTLVSGAPMDRFYGICVLCAR